MIGSFWNGGKMLLFHFLWSVKSQRNLYGPELHYSGLRTYGWKQAIQPHKTKQSKYMLVNYWSKIITSSFCKIAILCILI
uniref:Uncharacterized protein n=1 Tax=Anguilla anguilla TaxID=7936 RepID=A0A0E9QZ37_ANGAN